MEANTHEYTYGIVPFFCNKMEPMVQYVDRDLDTILDFFNTSIGITDEELLSALFNDFTQDITDDMKSNPRQALINEINFHNSFGVVLQVHKGFISKSKLLNLFYISLPECMHDRVNFLIIRFDGTIANVWKEVQEHCYP